MRTPTWHTQQRPGGWALPGVTAFSDLLPTGAINVRHDQCAVGIVDLPIFVLADLSPLLGQESFLNNVNKQLLVRSIGKAKQVVQALGRCAVLVRKDDVTPHLQSSLVKISSTAHLQFARIGVGS